LFLYVDDILILSRSKEPVDGFLSDLCFKYTDNGEVSVCLEINVVRRKDGIFFNQSSTLKRIPCRTVISAVVPIEEQWILERYNAWSANAPKHCDDPYAFYDLPRNADAFFEKDARCPSTTSKFNLHSALSAGY
jgi:hypothetical protein